MSTSLPSLMTRKKKMSGFSGLNHAKVIADYASDITSPKSFYQENFNHSKENERIRYTIAAGKERQSVSNQMTFLYENSRFINQPICFANSKGTRKIQESWWPDKAPVDNKIKPTYNTKTINRTDYTLLPMNSRATRFGSTKYTRVESILPNQSISNHQNNDLLKNSREKISYKHDFDCRKERTEKGKLHGTFVWERQFSN